MKINFGSLSGKTPESSLHWQDADAQGPDASEEVGPVSAWRLFEWFALGNAPPPPCFIVG